MKCLIIHTTSCFLNKFFRGFLLRITSFEQLYFNMYIRWDYVPNLNKKKKMYSCRLLTVPYFSREQSRLLVTLGVHTIKPSCKCLFKSLHCFFSKIYFSKYKVSCTRRIRTLNMITIDNMPTEYSKVFEFKLKSCWL